MVKNHTLLNVSLETEDANSQAKHNESRKAYLYLKKIVHWTEHILCGLETIIVDFHWAGREVLFNDCLLDMCSVSQILSQGGQKMQTPQQTFNVLTNNVYT